MVLIICHTRSKYEVVETQKAVFIVRQGKKNADLLAVISEIISVSSRNHPHPPRNNP